MGLWLPQQKPPRGAMLNPSHPLARGLAGAWLLNEASGSYVWDYSGNNRVGTLSNASWTAGGVLIENSVSRITADWTMANTAEGTLTIIATPFFSHNDLGKAYYLWDTYGGSNRRFLLFKLNNDDACQIYTDSTLRGNRLIPFIPFQTQILTVSWPLNDVYNNGEYLLTFDDGNLGNSASTIYFGDRYTTSNESFYGIFKTIYQHNRVLSAEEVRLLHQNPYAMFMPAYDAGVFEYVASGPATPTVVTLDVSLVRGTTAKFNGELTDMNGQAAIDCYFQYKITGAGSWSDTSANKEELTAVGEFSYEISGLTENESYDVRAVAEWTDGTLQNAYGDTETFNAFWVREGSQEDFERGILDNVQAVGSVLELSAGYTEFSEYTTGVQPSDWTIRNISTTYSVVADSGATGGKLLRRHSGGTLANRILSWDTPGNGGIADFDIITKFKGTFSTASNWYCGLVARGSGSSCYVVRVGGTRAVPYVAIFKLTSGAHGDISDSTNALEDLSTTLDVDTYYYMRFQGIGTALKAKCWRADLTEPASWMAWGTDSDFTSGYVGIFGGRFSDNYYFDTFNVRNMDNLDGTRQKPYKITNASSEITWSATTPIGTSFSGEVQVQGTTAISGEAVGTGDGVETVFTLDHWPANTPTITVNAVAETGFTLGDDRRTITFTTAPADTHAVTASYTAVDDPQEDDPEIQELDLDGPTGGTFKLGDGTDWTADIAHDASAATIETALEGLYGAGNFEVAKEVLETYTTVGTTSWTVPAGVNAVDVLVVAGGGSGGAGFHMAGGGGGAGGIKDEENHAVTPGSDITVVVGDGGAAVVDSSESAGNKGGDSSFDTLTAIGGGAGGGRGGTAGDGGSGGGGGNHGSGAAGSTEDATQGFNGGDAGAWDGSWYRAGGGGGGAGEIGAAGSSSKAGDGGDGLNLSDRFGTEVGDDGWFGGGGGGSEKNVGTAGDGGKGGGGDGDMEGTARSVDAMANTGGGGGASNANASTNSGKGGSGIVIIALPKFVITFDISVGNSGLVADFTGLT